MNRKDIPQGFAMALAQNKQALVYFTALDADEQKEICCRINSLNTKEEMKEFVRTLGNGQKERTISDSNNINETIDTKSYT